MKIRLLRGYHSREVFDLVEKAWTCDELLVLCPPFLKDLSFVGQLPEGPVELHGDWGPAELERAADSAPAYPEAPVLGVFTSGTVSGQPRLVLYSKRNIESSIGAILSVFEPGRIDSIFCYPQPFHTFGLVLGYAMSFLRGFGLTTGTGRYSSAFHDARAGLKEQGLLTLGTPTHFHDLLQYVRDKRLSLAPSYSCVIGGAKVSSELWRDVRDELKISAPSIGYGATEASPGVAHHPPGREPLEDGEIGFAFEQVGLRLHPGHGLEFAGPSMCLAMIQNGELRFPASVFLSDDVRRRSDGMLVYHGRTELIMNRGGQKFSLEHMEELVRRQLNLEVVCLSLPDKRLGEELGVLLRVDPDGEERAARERIYHALCQAFDSKFDLANFVGVSEFPMSENAKIDRKGGAELCLKHRARELS